MVLGDSDSINIRLTMLSAGLTWNIVLHDALVEGVRHVLFEPAAPLVWHEGESRRFTRVRLTAEAEAT